MEDKTIFVQLVYVIILQILIEKGILRVFTSF